MHMRVGGGSLGPRFPLTRSPRLRRQVPAPSTSVGDAHSWRCCASCVDGVDPRESSDVDAAHTQGYLSKVPGGLEKLLPQWQDFYNNYRNAVANSGVAGANEQLVAKVQATIADTVTLQFMQPYTFPSKHERLLAPYNYFDFGQRYVSTLVNFDKVRRPSSPSELARSQAREGKRAPAWPARGGSGRAQQEQRHQHRRSHRGGIPPCRVSPLVTQRTHLSRPQTPPPTPPCASTCPCPQSVLGHRERWDQVASWLAQGHNVVLLANHQTEADPGVFAHMLLASHPRLAQDVIYVAGDRVVTDPLCKPFSMGRNLFCVHSKKHLDDVPELKAAKMDTNRKTLVAMQRALNAGGTLVWIAPSGGRDRPKGEPARTSPDPFDPAAVELMRNLSARAKQPGHLVPMAMFSYPIMPPPVTVDKSIGERRITNFSPVGISICEELDVAKVLAGAPADDKEAQQRVRTSLSIASRAREGGGDGRVPRSPRSTCWRGGQPGPHPRDVTLRAADWDPLAWTLACPCFPPVRHRAAQVLAKAAEEAVRAEYDLLEKAIFDPSARGTTYTQPWKQ